MPIHTETDKDGLAPALADIQSGIQVSSAPAAGQGFALNPQGHIPVVSKDGQMTVEIHSQAVNLGNHVSNNGGTSARTIPGLMVGDLVEFMSIENITTPGRGFIFSTDPVCTIADTINLYSFNASGADADLPERTFYFRITHRFL